MSSQSETLTTAFSHQCLTLIGASFIFFEILFLELYADNFWFASNISWLGVPAIILVAIFAHFFLSFLESPAGCRSFAFIFKGSPPVVYRKWLCLNASGVTFGLRHVRFQVVDEVSLSFFGNLLIKSAILCGAEAKEKDIILKIPFGPATQAVQSAFVSRLQENNAALALNQRLEKRLSSPIVKGQALIQLFGSVFMAAVLLDLANSSFFYLQTLKEYYLCDLEARQENRAEALNHLSEGDRLYNKPPAVSFVLPQLLFVGGSGAGVLQARAQALWSLKQKKEAIEDARKAVDLDQSFRSHLRLARFFAEDGQSRAAQAESADAIELHRDSLLPRLYMLALVKPRSVPAASALYQKYMDDFEESTFDKEPMWPPGGNRFLSESFYSDDVRFILDRLLSPLPEKSKARQPE